MPAIFKKANKIEEKLLETQDRLGLVKSYGDIGLTMGLRFILNKEIKLLKTKLEKELLKVEGN